MLTFELVCSHLSDEQLDRLHTAVFEERRKRRAIQVPSMPALSDHEKEHVREGKRIDAIRAYRNRVGCDLLTARDVIVRYQGRA